MLEGFQKLVVKQICAHKSFEQYTNVRRYLVLWLNQIKPNLLYYLLEHLPAEILVFVLTDPTLAFQLNERCPDLADLKPLLPIFKRHYREFTKKRVSAQQKQPNAKPDYLLPKAYHQVYTDTVEAQRHASMIAEKISEQILELRAVFGSML